MAPGRARETHLVDTIAPGSGRECASASLRAREATERLRRTTRRLRLNENRTTYDDSPPTIESPPLYAPDMNLTEVTSSWTTRLFQCEYTSGARAHDKVFRRGGRPRGHTPGHAGSVARAGWRGPP